ncbi:MAG: prephenate dehydratase [Acidimicrobiia bacterium]|nr:prephenate dehydratase [Acidimicrobiia bacterium]
MSYSADQDQQLKRLRGELDAIDARIVQALADRLRVIGVIAAFKEQRTDQIRDEERERLLLERLSAQARELRLDPHFVTRLFREILDYSLRRQQDHLLARERGPDQPIVVAYSGAPGAWGHLAAERHFSARSGVEFRPFDSFRETMTAVKTGAAHFGLLPIENSTAGSINENYDLLAQMDLALVGEEIQPVDNCLMAVDEVPIERIRRVLSHPQAIAQCSQFLSTLRQAQLEAFANTALAARKVRDDQDITQAAIGSADAARIWGLKVLARDINDQKENFTRFVVVGPRHLPCDTRIACKTSLIFVTRHEKGALVACLNVLATRDLNLTKLESRPRPGAPWEYVFYVDFEGNLKSPDVEAALKELTAHVISLKVLGCYPMGSPRRPTPDVQET